MLIRLSDGSLYNMSWKGEFCGAFFLDAWLSGNGANKLSNHGLWSDFKRNSRSSFSVSKRGLKHTESIVVERRLTSSEVVCASLAPEQQIHAVGTLKGTVELYDLANSTSLIRTVSLHDWG
ncbi:hypothetical protein OROMI_002204 [Orobanche minor]